MISVVLAFFISPYMIRTLGDARYGTWTLIAQLTGYYGLLDFGVRGAVAYYAASLLATDSEDDVSRLASSAFWGLSVVAIVVLALGAIMVTGFPAWFETGGVARGEIRGAIIVLTITIALTLPFDVFAAIINGCRRPEIAQGFEIGVRIATGLSIVVALSAGGGLVALAAIQLAGKIFTWGALFGVTRRLIPSFRLSPHLLERAWIHKVVSYGSRNFVINISLTVIERLDFLVIGTFVGVRFVTYYSIGKLITGYASQACANVTLPFTMHFTHLSARGESEELRTLFLTGTRISGAIVGLLTGYMIIFGSSFIELWLGPEYVNGPWIERTDAVLIILAIAQAPRMLQSISRQLLFGTREVQFLMWLQVGEAISTLLLMLVLVRPYGMVGVALGALGPLVISNVLLMPRHVLKQLELPWRAYMRAGLLRPLSAAALSSLASVLLVGAFPIAGWASFIADAAAASAIGAVLVFGMVLMPLERQAILKYIRIRPAS